MKGNRSGDGMRVVQAELMSAVKSGAAEAYPQLVRVAGLSAADRLKVRTYLLFSLSLSLSPPPPFLSLSLSLSLSLRAPPLTASR